MLRHPRGNVSRKELKAIFAKLHAHKHVGFERMVIYLMNERDSRTGKYFTEQDAKEIASSIYRKQVANKEHIAKEKK